MSEALRADAATSDRSWRRVTRVWQAAFCVALGLAALAAAGDHQPWWVYVTLAAMAASFSWLLMPAMVSDGGGRRYAAHLAVTTLGCYAVILADGHLAFVASVGLSQFIPLLNLNLRGIALLAASAAFLTLPVALREHFTDGAVTAWLITALSAWVINLFIGGFTGELIQNSERRGALIRELEETRAELDHAHHEAGVQEERERLAREIHDTLAQGFTSILMLVQAAEATLDSDPASTRERLALAEQTARENLAEARALIGGDASAGLPLDTAIRRVAERTGQELGIEPRVLITGTPRQMSANVQVVLLRVVQEALANVRKHAHAGEFEVRLAYEEDGVRLTVVDDGVGMPPAAECVGFGLRSMRERVESVGGVVEVRSGGGGGGGLGGGGGGVTLRGGADARGTRVAAEVPYT